MSITPELNSKSLAVGAPSDARTAAVTPPLPGREAARSKVRPVAVYAPHPLRTERMVLRELRETDRGEFLRIAALTRTDLVQSVLLMRSDESIEEFFARQIHLTRLADQRSTAWRRIGVLDDGRIAGSFNLFSISRGLTFEADANWWISADQRGQGLGTEGVGAMLDFALADPPAGLGLHKISCSINPANQSSVRLARRVGLSLSPGARPVCIQLGNDWISHDLYSRSVVV